ncbi:response regulator [Parvularcula bermudensis HTCC2503]|uniref:Response regulator n=1 Tax=Parvularcula bermudensis (strain ATCC BAA-594 / HTCC2503 / KCTC 12087) TaxID=314260 RepID=E0TFF8_PARBH|nr:response regulator [Parvularcula bermudensis]ADM10082.1 response regulator [Parvularcula bermudensis HTCC2503]
MDFVKLFGPHLPYLRRYARALTGSQESGDAYIRASLSALAEDPTQIDEADSARVALYRFFHTIWGATGAELETSALRETASGPEDRLQSLAPVPRQAFLLVSLEGFRRSEAAQILGRSEAEVEALIDEAQRDIESDLRTRVLIIEDEAIIAADLEQLVTDLGHEVTGNAITKDEAIEKAKQSPPGLVLCDIQLADDSSGIDAAQEILALFDVPIIFITAYPERLLTGERPEPTYLISKPFQDNTVKAAIGQALFFHPRKEQAA